MQPQTKICQNCKTDFTIEPEDFVFYEKIKVPAPTWCPECRMKRRFVWRNERTLYKNKCGLCKRSIISIYSTDKPYTVYCSECFHGDKWDALSFGQNVDFSKPFLQQFKELQLKVPRIYAFVFQNYNSEYTNGSAFNKNCYLIFVSDHNEDCSYSYSLFYSKDSFDCFNSSECELCYGCISCKKCYKVLFSEDCSNSQDLIYCKNCTNCHDCVGSVNLRNQQYSIFNVQYSKEEYFKIIKELNIDTREGLENIKQESEKLWVKHPTKYTHGFQNVNVIGDYVVNSKNSEFIFDSDSVEDSKFLNHGNKVKSCYDGYVIVDGSELSYEIVSAISLNNVKFSYCAWHNFDGTYMDTCENSNHLFGCIGLRKKQYCILNKQYTKEEYEKLLPKIIENMKKMPYVDSNGQEYYYGEYFAPDLSPFAYNETVAQEYLPLSQEKAKSQGYKWKEPEMRNYIVEIKPEELPISISSTSENIVGKVIGCEHKEQCIHQCTLAFKITDSELQFYKKMNLPLPNKCPNCRHAERFAKHNPLKFWSRVCQCKGDSSTNDLYSNTAQHSHGNESCQNEFETTYAPDRKEIVYCEKCYQQEVY